MECTNLNTNDPVLKSLNYQSIFSNPTVHVTDFKCNRLQDSV